MVKFITPRSTRQAYNANAYVSELNYIPIVEDINLTNYRLFINKQAYNTNSLAIINGKEWHFNSTLGIHYGLGNVNQNSFGAMYLYNGAVSCFAHNETGGGGGSAGRWHWNWYHSYLDPNYPIRNMIKFASNNIHYTLPAGAVAQQSVSAIYNYGGLYKQDITDPPWSYSNVAHLSFIQNGQGCMFEDTTANATLWTLSHSYTPNTYIYVTNGYNSGLLATTIAYQSAALSTDIFWMGNDSANNPYFMTVARATANEPVSVLYANVLSKTTVTSVLAAQVPATSNAQLYNMAIPSNVRTDNATRRAIYTAHWDSSNLLAPLRFVWNPSVVGSVTKTNCTITYPGANTYTNYAVHYANTGAQANLSNIYMMKPYQFTVGSTNYITFATSDLGTGVVSNSNTRFSNTLLRTWVTYSLGAGTADDQLTYHSSYVFDDIFKFPRNWMAMPQAANTLAVAYSNGINFMQFSTTNGWEIKNSYYGRICSMGFDQTNRMWAYVGENSILSGGALHIVYANNVPVSTSLVFSSNNVSYSGTNVSITAALNAYDYANNRMVANVTLDIDGGSMTFSDDTKTQTVSTSASGDTTVTFKVINGGTSSVIPSINI